MGRRAADGAPSFSNLRDHCYRRPISADICKGSPSGTKRRVDGSGGLGKPADFIVRRRLESREAPKAFLTAARRAFAFAPQLNRLFVGCASDVAVRFDSNGRQYAAGHANWLARGWQ